MERHSNGPDCVKRKLEVISKKLTQKTDPTEGIPPMFGNGRLMLSAKEHKRFNSRIDTLLKSTIVNPLWKKILIKIEV